MIDFLNIKLKEFSLVALSNFCYWFIGNDTVLTSFGKHLICESSDWLKPTKDLLIFRFPANMNHGGKYNKRKLFPPNEYSKFTLLISNQFHGFMPSVIMNYGQRENVKPWSEV